MDKCKRFRILSLKRNSMKIFNYIAFLSTVLILLSGCRRFEQEKIVAKADPFVPQNLYPVEKLPPHFNKVVILPSYYNDFDSPVLEYIDEIISQELAQERIFETVTFSVEDMLRDFKKERFASTERLPENFLRQIEYTTNANGVLFVDIHSQRSYRPMSLGIRAKLVDIKTGDFMWAIDETFDAGHGSVIVGANEFQNTNHIRAISSKTSGSVLHSPRVFAKYVFSTCFSTLPQR